MFTVFVFVNSTGMNQVYGTRERAVIRILCYRIFLFKHSFIIDNFTYMRKV